MKSIYKGPHKHLLISIVIHKKSFLCVCVLIDYISTSRTRGTTTIIFVDNQNEGLLVKKLVTCYHSSHPTTTNKTYVLAIIPNTPIYIHSFNRDQNW